jgi:hypothetical protein
MLYVMLCYGVYGCIGVLANSGWGSSGDISSYQATKGH